MKTWHAERAVVAAVLLGVALVGGHWQDFVGSAAVLLSFAHAQIADRLRERSETSSDPVHCSHLLDRYWVAKEALWALYFVSSQAWPALAGCVLFLAYPAWRRMWRRVHPRAANGT